MTVPSSATPAATIAITSGVAAVSNCPIEESASCDSSIRVSKADRAARTGTSSFASSKPKFPAIAAIRSSPVRTPSQPSTLLQLAVIAASSDRPARSQAGVSLTSGVVVPGRTYGWGAAVGASMSVTTPSASAAAAVTTLKVEPGG